mmetsp:Transcript_5683/g.17972  ORF Transcript_5683/g.17972 Transcript_5683/m.17972 type:complete len:332 (-) Transcript_5683:372-1367(-)
MFSAIFFCAALVNLQQPRALTPTSWSHDRRAALRQSAGAAAAALVGFTTAGKKTNAAAVATKTTTTPAKELVSGLAGGAAQRIAKDLVLHPFDTVKSRLQRKGARLTRRALADPYAGVLAPLLVGVPAGALFFGVKDATAVLLSDYNEDVVELATVAVANGPYWLFRSPAELVKVRQQLGTDLSAVELVREILAREGVAGFYVGALESYAYALPTDLVKFYAYRKLKQTFPSSKNAVLRKAALGSLASATAQLTTSPLDVVRTRVMDDDDDKKDDLRRSSSIPARILAIANDEGAPALWAGLTPKLLRALVSGGLQFGSYEFTKRFFNQQQ